MRICIVSPHAEEQSGIGRVVLNVAEQLIEKNHEVGIITAYGDYKGDLLLINFILRNPVKIISNLFRMFVFIKKYDLVLCYDARPAGFYAALVSFVSKKDFYLHCIGSYSLFLKKKSIKNLLMKLVFASAKKTFVLSNIVKDAIEHSSHNFKIKNPVLVPPGVMVDFFKKVPIKSDLVDAPYIITVGAVKSRKGQDLSIQAFAKLSKEYPELKYVIVGDFNSKNTFEQNLLKFIKNVDINKKIVFIDSVDDVSLRELYSNAEFFVMTPRTTPDYIEGFGIVYLEAALCRLTSIGTFSSGAEDAIIHNKTGVLCNPTVDSICSAMKLLLNEVAVRSDYANEAYLRAQEFSWENIVSKYLSHFKQSKNYNI